MLLCVVACLALPVFVGLLYQQIATWYQRRTMTRDGTFVRLGRYDVYTQRMGHGQRTVVFESGLVAGALNWLDVQRTVSAQAGTFAYDRLGLGWSDLGGDRERTPSVLAEELHDLLAAAGVAPPYVLVGHSFGALIVRMFALRYVGEVAGIVLLDPMRTEGWLPENAAGQMIMKGGRALMSRSPMLVHLGLVRLSASSLLQPQGWSTWMMKTLLGKNGQRSTNRMTRELDKMPRDAQAGIVAQWCRLTFWKGCRAHIHAVPAGVAEMLEASPVRGLPALVLRPEGGPLTLPAFAHCSGATVVEEVVCDSGHWMHLDQPDAVVRAIERMLAAVQPAAETRHAGETVGSR